jgi:hypothetical protein
VAILSERVAIVGTAGSWELTPWTDTSLSIWSLNDAYRIPGFQRADRWFDFHPLDKFIHVAGPVYAHQIPAGFYARPKDHLQWLGQQTIPIYLHPDYKTQCDAAQTWAHARPFPKAPIEDYFGRYFTSSPAWMIAQAVMEGAKELHIYGIHLATEFEYVKQRPNFEFLCGCVLGKGRRTLTVKDGLRHYESADGLIVIPEASPILQSDFQYAFDPRPDGHLEPMKWELHKLALKKQRVQHALMTASWLSPVVSLQEPDEHGKLQTVRKTRSQLRDSLYRFEALSQDWQEQMQRASVSGAL